MAEQDWLAGQFEQNRQHLQAVATACSVSYTHLTLPTN